MNPAGPQRAASVRARLLNVAKAQGVDFSQVLVRFALERMLYRLTRSPHADRFLLKGALLFTLWYDMPHRATRDADLLGFGASDLESVARVFRDIAAVAADDGIVFDPASVTVEEIRKEAGYGGVRVIVSGELARARCRTQIDVGFGDAVTPAPVDSIYPVLLEEMPAPRLRTYPVTVPDGPPAGLTDEFAHDASRQSLWLAFLRKNELPPEPLPRIVDRLRRALLPALDAVVR